MSAQRFSPEFKAEVIRRPAEREYSVVEIAASFGASTHSLYKWVKAITPDKSKR
ncbi:transposase-like protein [Pseudomonas nitritireducens]|uniref:Transposase-like protein n=1 Tax=Pseudomonas nitroreducens TaxID=46680 RepID=A0A7W7KQ80_PSENT|nr:transposase-like protein [Pseudomonas nitritireducens]